MALSKTFLYLVVGSLIVGSSVEEETKLEGLPFCDEHNSQEPRLVLVSTLDGKISALNTRNGGAIAWSVPTGPGSMLSSSIHRMELTNNGRWVRMIPSLSGSLYKFDGESIEAVPINAHQLLQNSFRYSEDLVISGGRETRTYGLDMSSGRLLYECTMRGCDNFTDDFSDAGQVLLLQRETQTIRAVEPRTGSERWNYSVAQHNVRLMRDPNAECHDNSKSTPDDLQIKVIVPEGLVCALSTKDPHKVLWKHKFDTPVVHAWNYQEGQVKAVDLFSGSLAPPWSPPTSHPSLYVGMHLKQLYIQESVTLQRGVSEKERPPLLEADDPSVLRIPWKPFSASSMALGWPENNEIPQLTDESSSDSTTAISVLYASEYVNGNGFYLFSPQNPKEKSEEDEEAANEKCETDNSTNNRDEEDEREQEFRYSMGTEDDEEETPVQIIIVSLWYWWKEVIIISITTAILFNLFFTQRFLYLLQRQVVRDRSEPTSSKGSDSGLSLVQQNSFSQDESSGTQSFTSRYLDDFEQVRCLGRGGFGVVFEARKKIDDCSYAVKRIALPNRKESRDRVMREVKALAKLEHPHIVRYYHSWLECPPTGWQEDQDRHWLKDMQSRDSLLPSSSPPSSSANHYNQLLPYRKRCPSTTVNIPSEGKEASEDEDSFIQFQEPSRSKIPPMQNNPFIQFQEPSLNPPSVEDDSFIQFKEPSQQISLRPSESCIQVLDSSRSDTPTPTKALGSYVPLNGSLSISTSEEEMQGEGSSDEESTAMRTRSASMFLYIQMQLCQKESLSEWLQRRNAEVPARADEALHVFHQITQAVEYVHLQGLIHRDLKPSNIFFSMDGHIKVGDFGLVTAMVETMGQQRTPCDERDPWESTAAEMEQKHTANVGTKLYMSPEQLHGLPYDHKVDIYSLGLILFELLVPFSTLMERAKTLQSLRDKQFPQHFQQQYRQESSLLELMLSHCPEERPSAPEIRLQLPLASQLNT